MSVTHCSRLSVTHCSSSYCSKNKTKQKQNCAYSYNLPHSAHICFSWGRRDRRSLRSECHRLPLFSSKFMCFFRYKCFSDYCMSWDDFSSLKLVVFVNFVQFCSCFSGEDLFIASLGYSKKSYLPHPFAFNVAVCIFLKWVSCSQHKVESCFFYSCWNCLLNNIFSLIFNVISVWLDKTLPTYYFLFVPFVLYSFSPLFLSTLV